MDACDPGINIGNLKRLVKQNTGLELDLTREQICDAYSSIQDGKLPLPPMVLSKDGKYMLDRKSPLTGKDFEVLFGSDSTVSQLKRVARKAGLASYDNMTKAEMVEAIESTLQSKNIREPSRLHISAQRAVRKVSVNNNNNYPNNLNVNNTNGNGVRNNNNLRKIANESNNLNRGNGNRNGNGNNLAKIANESRNLNRGNGNRGNENRGNGNRGNGNRGNGNRGNGNRGNERPSINRTTARYVNAMLRKPNARRNEDLARVLSAARNTGGGSTQNLSRIIEAVRRKPSTDGSTATMLNKLMRAKTSGNSNALQRAMKEIEELKRRPVAARVNNKQQKLAELEKYAVNKASKLGNQRLQFMNEAQKHIKAYKNGEYGSEFAKKQIFIRYDQIYKKRLNDMGFNEAATNLQKSTINAIGNTKIKSKAVELLEEYKKTGSTPIRNSIIKLKSLDENLRSKEESVVKLFGNRKPLNSERDEALQNIQSYNMRNGLAKINKQIEEKKKERGVEFNKMIVNDTYKNVPSNVKTTLRNKYVSGELNSNGVKRGLNNALEETAGVFKGLENKIKNLESKLGDSKLTATQRNALKKEVNNLKLKRNTNLKNMNVMREQLGNMKATVNTKNRNIERLKIKQENANAEIKSLRNKLQKNKNLSNGEKRALQEQLNNAMKNRASINNRLEKSELEKKQYMREMNTLAGNVRNITKQKENANKEIANLRNKLQKNKNLSNGEKRALQEQLNNAMKNRASINNRLEKSESEKKQYMREMNTLAGNVRNITKQKENANKEIANLKKKLNSGTISNAERKGLENQLAKAWGEALVTGEQLKKLQEEKKSFNAEIKKAKMNVKAARTAQSKANKNRNTKVADAQKKAEESIKSAQNNASRVKENANARVARVTQNANDRVAKVTQNANDRVAAAQAIAQERMNALRVQANQEVANAKHKANAASRAASKAEENVARLQSAAGTAEKILLEQRATVNRLERELQSAKNISEEQREKLEKELSTERLQVAQASAAANKAKKNAEAAVAESRNLVAKASVAANKASMRAAEAEQAKLAAENERQKALGNKAKANEARKKANLLREEANLLRAKAQAEANEARKKANAANAKANEISEKLAQANLNKAEMNNLIKQKNAFLENRQKEMQKQINAITSEYTTYKTQKNRIVRNGANREADQRNRIKALESKRNELQAEFNLAKQRIAVKNADLLKKINQIKQTQSNLAMLQKELNNTKTASAAEKNAIEKRLEKEKQNLSNQFTRTRTLLSSTKAELNKITRNRSILFKELQNRSGTLSQTRAELNELQRQLEETRKILQNTQNNLGQLALAEQRARGQRNTLSKTLAQVRGQRQNLRRRNVASQKVITGLTQQRRNAQRGINALRAQTRNLEQRRLAENRSTNSTFNASAAFNRQMKGVAARQRWQSLKPKATMVRAAQLGVGKALREKLLKNVDTTNINGKLVVNGGFMGSERRALKKEVQDPMTGLNRLRAIEKMILNRKTNRNSTILGRRRMNRTLRLAGSSINNKFSFASNNTPAQSRSQLLKQNNAWAGGPAAEARIRGQAFAS